MNKAGGYIPLQNANIRLNLSVIAVVYSNSCLGLLSRKNLVVQF